MRPRFQRPEIDIAATMAAELDGDVVVLAYRHLFRDDGMFITGRARPLKVGVMNDLSELYDVPMPGVHGVEETCASPNLDGGELPVLGMPESASPD